MPISLPMRRFLASAWFPLVIALTLVLCFVPALFFAKVMPGAFGKEPEGLSSSPDQEE